ncbi:uncharacterized protein [Blastocystis hominis]|uniref:Phosphomannomutase n=1 Tax=Blastocystis hominis TaxID=12968 RepID=D8LZ10_BLAHO|nr:uncharacterized protein [Blastocystis hominis]CBK21049.2 unnamed protein product [Blastocystis hominis]|eukprot:XP_012895097.1 uncharacterized protein [Blastocystis hominis]
MLQLTPEGDFDFSCFFLVAEEAEFLFSQNGGETYKHNVLSQKTLLTSLYSDKELNSFISYVLFYLSQLDIPVKRGTFVEFRSSLINICPVGRNASCEERLAFSEYDREHHVREKMINDLQQRFSQLHFTYLIGGLTSFDVVPEGMDKTFCLQYLTDYDTIYFFGDKTNKGGNDYEIYVDPRTIGYSVTCPKDTKAICEKLFLH